jgi:hypothetical protein
MKMKNYLFASTLLLYTATATLGQNNIELVPQSGDVCNPMQLSIQISGNSFNPESYLWNTGETTASIQISSSGTYTVTVTGYLGSSGNVSSITTSGNYNMLAAPQITALTDLWVCKGDTVRLMAVSGYDLISWSNGFTGELFQKKMNNPGTPGFPAIDTMSVNYTASIDGVCSTTSETVMLRSIRKPHGVGRFYQGRMNIASTDSIPAGLVMEYLYPVSYEMSFTELANPLNIIKYNTQPGSRKTPASILTPGAVYSVETTPIINGVRYCSGLASTIGIAGPSGSRLSLNSSEVTGLKTYRVIDVQGRILMERNAETFNAEWLSGISPQMLIIQRIGDTTEVFKVQLAR